MGSFGDRKAKVDQTGRNPDKVGSEDRTIITRRSFWHSPHIAALSGAGPALVVELQSMFNGANNGTLFLSVRDAADRLGFTDLEAAQNAMAELERMGLVTVTIDSSFAMKAGEASRARAYGLNWIGADGKCVGADALGPLDFSELTKRQKKRIAKRSEALGRYLKEQRQRKSAVRETRTLMADSVRETRTEAATSVRESRMPKIEKGEKPPTPHVRDTLTHILHHIPKGQGDDVDPVTVIRHSVAHWWRTSGKTDRLQLAKKNGLEITELHGFVDGSLDLPFPKAVALRACVRAAA